MDFQFIKEEQPVEYVIEYVTCNQISTELLDVKQEPDYICCENEVEANEAQQSAHSNGMKYEVANEAQQSAHSNGMKYEVPEIQQLLDVHVKQEPDCIWSGNEAEANEAQQSPHSNGMKYEVQEIQQLLDVHVKQEPDYIWSGNEAEANEAQLSAYEMEYEVSKLNVARSTNSSKSKNRKSKLKDKSNSRIRERNYKCDKCEATFVDKKFFLIHTARHEQSDIDQCTVCKKFFPKSIIQFHTESHSGPPFTCKVCLKIFLNKGSWNHHRFIHENNLLECDICGKQVKSKNSMLDHLKVHRERTNNFHCKICQSSFFRIQTLNRHIKKVHGAIVHTCSNTLCKRAFIEKSSLDAHKCRNISRKNVPKQLVNLHRHPCDKCKKLFHNLHHLVLHVAQNCSERITYHCDYCSKSFVERGSLINHFGSQHKFGVLRRRTCYKCHKTFSSKSALKIHNNRVYCRKTLSQPTGLKIYSIERVAHLSNKKYAENLNETQGQNFDNFSCDICGRIFVQKVYIVEHMLLVHSKNDLQAEKECSDRRRSDKLNCSICIKTFQKQGQLRTHILSMHRDALETFVCGICNKSFSSEKLYVKHVEGLGCRKKIQCAICSKIFKSKSGLSSHWARCNQIHGIMTKI